jgi:SAM-dependent methyltransferase
MRPLPPTTPYDEVLATAQTWCDTCVSSREHARALDAGSGLESYVALPQHVHLTGIDVSQELLAANTRLDERIHADLGTVELPERSYDCVTCWNVLEHLENPEPVVKKLARSVADGGILLIGAPSPSSVKGLVTKLTPYAFHLWVYRRYVDPQASDAPGEGPYRTFMKRAGGLKAVRQTAEQLGLTVVYAATIESPLQQALRKRYGIEGKAWAFARRFTRLLSLGLVDAEATDYLVIFQRRTTSTRHPESPGIA